MEDGFKPKPNQLVICSKCYREGNIPTILSSVDFVKVDLTTKINPSNLKNAG